MIDKEAKVISSEFAFPSATFGTLCQKASLFIYSKSFFNLSCSLTVAISRFFALVGEMVSVKQAAFIASDKLLTGCSQQGGVFECNSQTPSLR